MLLLPSRFLRDRLESVISLPLCLCLAFNDFRILHVDPVNMIELADNEPGWKDTEYYNPHGHTSFTFTSTGTPPSGRLTAKNST